jgi:hypothetical protein
VKPRIRRYRNLWECHGVAGNQMLLGFGKTPGDAYSDWVRRVRPGRVIQFDGRIQRI